MSNPKDRREVSRSGHPTPEYRSGHPTPEPEKTTVVTIGEMAGHEAPDNPAIVPDKQIAATGHPSPPKPQPMNMAPPPKRTDSESSAKPPDKR